MKTLVIIFLCINAFYILVLINRNKEAFTRYAENGFSFSNLILFSKKEKKECKKISFLFIINFIAFLILLIIILSTSEYEFVY